MAAVSIGAFGAYKQAYSRYLQELEQKEKEIEKGTYGIEKPESETVWITKRYVPTDLRSLAPVPRHKLLVSKQLPAAEGHWIPNLDPPLRSFERGSSAIYPSHPSTRCEEYSTLRQMLPSSGSFVGQSPPNWGTSYAFPPINIPRPARRYPIINSPMTRYSFILSYRGSQVKIPTLPISL